MRIKLKIQQKIQFFIISVSILIYIVAFGYISINSRKTIYNDAIKLTDKTVNEVAENISGKLSKDLSVCVTLAQAFQSSYKRFSKDEWQDIIHGMYLEVFSNNPQIYALWDSWELSAVDPDWDKPYGRIANTFWRENNKVAHNSSLRSLDGDSELYVETKSKTEPSVSEPYLDALTGDEREALLMGSLNAPVLENNKYIGVVSLDITLKQFQEMMVSIKPFSNSIAFMVSNTGIIAGHPNEKLLNKNISNIFPDDNKKYKILKKIKKGEKFSYISSSENGIKTYYTYVPIQIGNTDTPWSIAISVPVKTIMEKADRTFVISIIVAILGILLLALVILIISKNITNPITKITHLLKKLDKGHIGEEMRINLKTGDEIEEMAEALDNSIVGLNKKAEFATHIEHGELDKEFKLLSEKDILGKSLLDMRNSLFKARKEEEKRKIEDNKRRWANEGLAKFADILRQNNDNLENLATEIIIHLVNYLDANQGGLFIINDEDEQNIYLSLLSAFAYDRRKYLEKQIMLGEGLVGTCAIEKKTMFMTDIPQDYIEITSGLGGANPNSLLIVPLKLEDNVLGVIEIASFNIFEDHEIEFIEKLAESIASTLSSVRINIKTTQLLEKSQQQAEEMAAQEEEMRQNMEELQATQEESARKSAEMQGFVEALNTSSNVIEYDLDGYIQNINDNYLKLLGITRDEAIGTHHSGNVEFTKKQKADYEKFWDDLRKGKIRQETVKVKINEINLVFAETYTPIKNTEGEIYKILKISNNITDIKN